MTLPVDIAVRVEEELAERARRERVLALRAGDFAPSVRDQAIFRELCLLGRPAEEVAERFYLAPRTVKNVAARTRDRLARRELAWGGLSAEELAAEEERLDDLWCEAMEAWRRSTQPLRQTRVVHGPRGTRVITTTRPQTGTARLMGLARAIMTDLTLIAPRIRPRREAELEEARREWADVEHVSNALGEPRASATGVDRVQPPVANAPGSQIAYVRRTRRRKSLGGRLLRLPPFVRAQRVSARAALLAYIVAVTYAPVARCRGDPRELAEASAGEDG